MSISDKERGLVNMGKIILTEGQIEALKSTRLYFGIGQILDIHEQDPGGWVGSSELLNELSLSDLKSALECGYYTKEEHIQILEKNADNLNDNVNKPNHYTTGKYEVIDYIQDKLTPEQYVGYCMGNVIKYTSRWEHKGGVQDLEKAEVYLKWAIKAAKENE